MVYLYLFLFLTLLIGSSIFLFSLFCIAGMVYVKSLETCLLPGQNKKIVIEPRNNYCSVHGHVSKQR